MDDEYQILEDMGYYYDFAAGCYERIEERYDEEEEVLA